MHLRSFPLATCLRKGVWIRVVQVRAMVAEIVPVQRCLDGRTDSPELFQEVGIRGKEVQG